MQSTRETPLKLSQNLGATEYTPSCLNTLRQRRNGRHFPNNFFLIENVWISIKTLLKFVPKGPIINIPALIQIMAWQRTGDKPLSEPMLVSLLTQLRVTQPQWLKTRVWDNQYYKVNQTVMFWTTFYNIYIQGLRMVHSTCNHIQKYDKNDKAFSMCSGWHHKTQELAYENMTTCPTG